MRVSGVDYCAACRQPFGFASDFFDFVPLGGDTLVAAIGHAFGAGGSAVLTSTGLLRLLRGLTAANCGEISRVVESMNRAISLNKMKPVVDRVFPFTDAVAAYRYMESGAHFGKVAIRI